MKTLVVDGTNIAMRSIKASERGIRLSVEIEGETINTGPVLLFINVLSKYVRQEMPDQMVVCFDAGRSRFRQSIYAAYKSERSSRDSGPDTQTFELIKQFLDQSGIQHAEIDGFEADDLVAAFVQAGGTDDAVILSGDKDFLQLLSPKVSQIRPGVNPEQWGVSEVYEKVGCFPEDISKVMALTGDKSDGIPGVPGFGDKTAVKFLTKYDWDLDRLLEAQEKRLVGHEEEVRRNLKLVDLKLAAENIEIRYIPPFPDPEVVNDDLVEWLESLNMVGVLSKLHAGVLWREPMQGNLL